MKLLRIKQVILATGLSRMTIYRLEQTGEFPRRRRLGRNSVAWLEEDIAAWIVARPVVAGTRMAFEARCVVANR